MLICAKMGVNFTVVSPSSLQPASSWVDACGIFTKASGARIEVSDNVDAVRGADALYTDVWVSMGEEAMKAERVKLLEPYRVDDALMKRTGNTKAIFLHCLPAVKGEEVSAALIDGPQSRAWDQAENRKHTIKAIMLATLC
jgi:ornithine carbamoyltransferase